MTFDGLVSSRERTNEESKKTLRRFFSLSLALQGLAERPKTPAASLSLSLSLFLFSSFPLFFWAFLRIFAIRWNSATI